MDPMGFKPALDGLATVGEGELGSAEALLAMVLSRADGAGSAPADRIGAWELPRSEGWPRSVETTSGSVVRRPRLTARTRQRRTPSSGGLRHVDRWAGMRCRCLRQDWWW